MTFIVAAIIFFAVCYWIDSLPPSSGDSNASEHWDFSEGE